MLKVCIVLFVLIILEFIILKNNVIIFVVVVDVIDNKIVFINFNNMFGNFIKDFVLGMNWLNIYIIVFGIEFIFFIMLNCVIWVYNM